MKIKCVIGLYGVRGKLPQLIHVTRNVFRLLSRTLEVEYSQVAPGQITLSMDGTFGPKDPSSLLAIFCSEAEFDNMPQSIEGEPPLPSAAIVVRTKGRLNS